MGRPPKDDVARTKQLHLKFTADQFELLGERARAAGQSMNEWARLWLLAPSAPAGSASAPESASPRKPEIPPPPKAEGGQKVHRHRTEVIDVRMDRGMKSLTVRCVECGEEWDR